VASALVSQAVTDSQTLGCRETYLFTEAGSEAEALYTKLGFVRWAKDALRRHIAS
jgi:N-acetylglutamate synthase-like GNAT family acetyltransferase